MNCSGRIVMATASNVQLNCSLEDYFNETHDLESDSKVAKVVKSSTSHFLVLVCDPIPQSEWEYKEYLIRLFMKFHFFLFGVLIRIYVRHCLIYLSI
jgi:hypothetical protein